MPTTECPELVLKGCRVWASMTMPQRSNSGRSVGFRSASRTFFALTSSTPTPPSCVCVSFRAYIKVHARPTRTYNTHSAAGELTRKAECQKAPEMRGAKRGGTWGRENRDSVSDAQLRLDFEAG
eukprot:1389366-Rhodomonas_salina.1